MSRGNEVSIDNNGFIIEGRIDITRVMNEAKDRPMRYEQLPDGTWKRKVTGPEYDPQPVRCWYMRDNHTFRSLPLDVDAAIRVMRQERDAGNIYGLLSGSPDDVLPEPVHARSAAEWPAFETAARAWLETAVARSKPPNDGEFRHVSVVRNAKTATTNGSEYIDGVLFVFAKTYDADGKLASANFTRADLVRG